MSEQLHQALTTIIGMPYFKNDHAQSGKTTQGHERAVANKIGEAGFIEDQRDLYPDLKTNVLRSWLNTQNDTKLREVTKGIQPGTYILQPGGSQACPDILVYDFTDRFVAVECKSGKGQGAPMWNDSLPKPDVVYVLASGTLNSTTVFLGRDVITKELCDTQAEMLEKLNEIVNEYKEQFEKLDNFNRGWDPKLRPQNFQKGADKGNYFKHTNKAACESNVLGYVQL